MHAPLQTYVDILTLGRGGMGEVKLAVAQGASGFKRLQVVKRLRPELTENPEFVAMFLQEARLAARLSHPNIVQTNEVGHDGASYYIAMEYLEGRTLSSILRRSRRSKGGEAAPVSRSPSQIASSSMPPLSISSSSTSGLVEVTLPLAMHLRVVADTLEGLHFAHELRDDNGQPLNLVHRDVSPVNIFITYDGAIKVLDFGIAKAADADVHTRTGVIKGKVAYMAPEQFFSKQIDRRCDVYAVGVMLWEAATGERLWQGLSDMDIVKRLGAKQVPTPASANPNVNARLNEICLKAMALKPDQRYQTAAALRDDLEELLDQIGGASSRSVGQFFGEVFSADRLKIKQATEKKLRELAQGGPVSTSPLTASSHAALGASGSNPSILSISNSSGNHDTPPSAPSISVRANAPTPSRPVTLPYEQPSPYPHPAPYPQPSGQGPTRGRILAPLLASTTMAILVAALAVVYVEMRQAPKPPITVPEPPSVKRIQLAVQAVPADAQIWIDDALMPTNPAIANFPMDGLNHRVRAEAIGFASKSELVLYDRPAQTVRVELTKLK